MGNLLESLEKVKHIDFYIWTFMLAMAITIFFVGLNHHEKSKQDQADILMLQSKLYREMAHCYADSALNYSGPDYDTVWAKKAIRYDALAKTFKDSAQLIK